MTTTATKRRIGLGLALALAAMACGEDGDDRSGGGNAGGNADGADREVTLVTHDSFAASEGVLEQFTEDTGIEVRLLASGDAGSALNQAILTKGDPQGDVFFGVDNTFLTRAFDEELFVPYESPALSEVDDEFVLDAQHRVTPIDYGDVCLNYDKDYFADLDEGGGEDAGEDGSPAVPATLEDLADPAYRDLLVVQNPATSSPGLAFLLATISQFGEDGWRDYWDRLRDNGVAVSDGWEDAYYGQFSGSASGTGDRPIVVSYASSPPAEVAFATEPIDEAPIGVVESSCFRQVEFAGILAGSERTDEAGELIDFLLSATFQEDMPLNMFVFPVRADAELPAVFVEHAATPDDPFVVAPDDIGANRDRWIGEWTATVLR